MRPTRCHFERRLEQAVGTPRKYAYIVKRQPEYCSWQAMRRRCAKTNRADFARYGAIGVTVCERWIESFEAFLVDVGRRPSPIHTLDRFPNAAGNYEPGNVRWATPREQAQNRKNTRWITFNGETECIREWARRTGINQTVIRGRLNRGWPIDRALSATRYGRPI